MALQAITIDDRLYDVEKAQRSFMNSLIFPNGCLPSVEVIARNVARRSDFRMVDLEDITPHYAETLRRWRANVDASGGQIRSLGYDERFLRLWRLYLSFCEAGFTERRIGSVQIVLGKPRWRGHLATAEALRARRPSCRGGAYEARCARVLGFRVAYGAALLVAPDKVTKSWLGPLDDAARVALRGLGAREIGLHGLAIAAVLSDAPVKPLLAVEHRRRSQRHAATALGRGGLPDGSAGKTAAVAGGVRRGCLTAPDRLAPVRRAARPAPRPRHRPPHVGPGARAPWRRRARARHAGFGDAPPLSGRVGDAARARRGDPAPVPADVRRGGQLARWLGGAGNGVGRLGAVGDGDRAGGAVVCAVGAEALRGAGGRARVGAGAAAGVAERARAARGVAAGRWRTPSACRTRPRCGSCGRTRTRPGSRPSTRACARGGSPGLAEIAVPAHARLVPSMTGSCRGRRVVPSTAQEFFLRRLWAHADVG